MPVNILCYIIIFILISCSSKKTSITNSSCLNSDATIIVDRSSSISAEDLMLNYKQYCLTFIKIINKRMGIDIYSYDSKNITEEEIITLLKKDNFIDAVQKDEIINNRK
jgi:hypothetical protein